MTPKPTRAFAHGTSRKHAIAIRAGGLDATRACGAALRGRWAERGSFFTFELEGHETDERLNLAYQMGLRQSDEPVVLICRIPALIVANLFAAGFARTGPVPGIAEPETVFMPTAHSRINRVAEWDILDPYERSV